MNFYNAIGRHWINALFKRPKDETNPSGIGLIGQLFVLFGLAGLRPPDEIKTYIAAFSLIVILLDAQGFHIYFIAFSSAFLKKLFKRS